MNEILSNGIARLGFSGDDAAALEQKMEAYIKEIVLFNKAYNLVDCVSPDDIASFHILDSLSAVHFVKDAAENMREPVIADIGSGGGLPGIPLAAALSQYSFTLVERMSKRCAFLENCTAILKLHNASVDNIEAERLPKESVDIAVFRAFRPMDRKTAALLLSLLKPNGILLAYKAKKAKIIQEMKAISDIIPHYRIKELFVPYLTDKGGDEMRERNLVVVEKKAAF